MIMDCSDYYKVAEAFICMREYDLAYVYYKKYIDLCNKDNAGAWHGLGITLQHKRMFRESKEAYKKALELHLKEKSPSGYLWGAWSAININDYNLAYELVKKSIEMDPDYSYSWKTLYIIARKLNLDGYEKYRERYESMIKEKPFQKRECEGLKMLLDLKNKWNEELRKIFENLITKEKYKDCGKI